MTKVAYVGNFVPEHSTENHVRQAWENQGHYVARVQEGDDAAYTELMDKMSKVDLVLWTRTNDLAAKWGHRKQWEMLSHAKSLHVPTVGLHLDRWWGLDREAATWEEPFFRCSVVFTADGGHQESWFRIGVNHIWMPPAVSLGETVLGTPRAEYTSDLAFVGSWQPGYHKEWTHRPQLVEWLRKNYGNQIQFWPKRGEPSVRGQDLRDLYASVKVVIGDSCLTGNATRYWSDRVPETIGRGGFLIHPYVEGIEEHFKVSSKHQQRYVGEHMWTWPVGDWDQLKGEINAALESPKEIEKIRIAGRQHVIENHTYDVRVQQILEIV